MLARIQQLIVALLLAAEFTTFVLAYQTSTAWWIGLVPTAGIGAYAAVLAFEILLLRRSYRSDDPVRPTFVELLRAWMGEVVAAPRAFLWRQPFFERAIENNLEKAGSDRRGVVLVHGFFCNRAIWNPWLQRLMRSNVPFVAVTLEPVFGSIDAYRDRIDSAVEAVRRATSLAPVVVAHSMGGLAVRAWMATRAGEDLVHRVVTIASPHAGTRMARPSRARNITEMQIGGAWLEELASREALSMRTRFVCFWGHCDNIVFPTRTARLAGADNRHLRATAHVQMVLHPEVIDTVLELVA